MYFRGLSALVMGLGLFCGTTGPASANPVTIVTWTPSSLSINIPINTSVLGSVDATLGVAPGFDITEIITASVTTTGNGFLFVTNGLPCLGHCVFDYDFAPTTPGTSTFTATVKYFEVNNSDHSLDFTASESMTFSASAFDPNAVATPLPGALPLFASGLGVLGFIAHRRKRKAVTV